MFQMQILAAEIELRLDFIFYNNKQIERLARYTNLLYQLEIVQYYKKVCVI